jgi:NitT/TauT family transport system ATP-binding protein
VVSMESKVAAPAIRSSLRVENVGMTFDRDGKQTRVLEDISLEVGEGEFLCLLGPSGCGKSTMLNIMAGFLSPTSGDVKVGGEILHGPDPRRIFVFQERGVFPWLTVEGNIGFGIAGLPRKEREQRIGHYIHMVGLEGFEKSYPSDLSGGMKQRLEVARALAVNPDMLLLDEPFGALDSITRLTMRKELLRIWEAEKKTIIFVTHDIDEAVQLADRVVVMSARPATIQQIVTIDIPHPRDISSSRYLELRDGIFKQIGLAHHV